MSMTEHKVWHLGDDVDTDDDKAAAAAPAAGAGAQHRRPAVGRPGHAGGGRRARDLLGLGGERDEGGGQGVCLSNPRGYGTRLLMP